MCDDWETNEGSLRTSSLCDITVIWFIIHTCLVNIPAQSSHRHKCRQGMHIVSDLTVRHATHSFAFTNQTNRALILSSFNHEIGRVITLHTSSIRAPDSAILLGDALLDRQGGGKWKRDRVIIFWRRNGADHPEKMVKALPSLTKDVVQAINPSSKYVHLFHRFNAQASRHAFTACQLCKSVLRAFTP